MVALKHLAYRYTEQMRGDSINFRPIRCKLAQVCGVCEYSCKSSLPLYRASFTIGMLETSCIILPLSSMAPFT
jgi:hypothetical protein